MFAASLESNLLPMAFVAWARYSKKNAKRKVEVQAMAEIVAIDARAETTEQQEEDTGKRLSTAELEEKAVEEEKLQNSIQKANLRRTFSRLPSFDETPTAGAGDGLQGLAFQDKTPSADDEQHAPLLVTHIDSSDAEDTDSPVRKAARRRPTCLALLCCKGKQAKQRLVAKEAKETAVQLAASKAAARSIVDNVTVTPSSGGAAPATSRSSPRADSTDFPTTPQGRSRPPVIDVKHAKRLGNFLDDVRGNPQRLVSHVERRRTCKITDSGCQMAFPVPAH
jgi:hypothetical protein